MCKAFSQGSWYTDLLTHVFFDSVFIYLASMHHRANLIVQVVSNSPVIQGTHSAPLLTRLSHTQAVFPLHPHPGTRYQIARDSSYAPRPAGIRQTADATQFTLPCLALPLETPRKAQPELSFCSVLPPSRLWCFPLWPCVACCDPPLGKYK